MTYRFADGSGVPIPAEHKETIEDLCDQLPALLVIAHKDALVERLSLSSKNEGQ
jgi:hypothetical protein